MKDMNRDEFSDLTHKMARQLWDEQGGLDLMVVVLAAVRPDGLPLPKAEPMVIMPSEPLQSTKDKEDFSNALRQLVAKVDAQMIAILTEVWAVEYKDAPAERLSSCAPSEHADRTEALMISIETKDGTISSMAAITTEGDVRKLSAFERLPIAMLEGRLSHFLPDRIWN